MTEPDAPKYDITEEILNPSTGLIKTVVHVGKPKGNFHSLMERGFCKVGV